MDDETTQTTLIGSWLVADIADGSVVADAQPTIQFGRDGVMSGSTGVNRFTGRYEVVGDEFRPSALASTRMAGSPAAMEQEVRFLAALAEPGTLTFEDGALTIGTDSSQLHLVRAEDDPPTDADHAGLGDD